MRSLPKLRMVAVFVLFVVAYTYACSWAKSYFYQGTRLRGKVVGANMGPLQYARWLRPSFVRSGVKLAVYEYRWPIHSRTEMPFVKTTEADSHGRFDFGVLPPGHYTLIVDDVAWGNSDWFDFEVTKLPRGNGIGYSRYIPKFSGLQMGLGALKSNPRFCALCLTYGGER